MVGSWTRSSRAGRRKRRPPAPPRARTPERLFVLGRGNLGRSLEHAFRAAGQLTSLVRGRTAFIEPPSFGIVFLAVPDQAVEEVAAKLARLKPSRRLSFVHVSGASASARWTRSATTRSVHFTRCNRFPRRV